MRMYHDKRPSGTRSTKANPPFLDNQHIVVWPSQSEWIAEDKQSLLEADRVFRVVRFRFVRVPFELEPHHDFSLYPVLKIHHTTARQIARKPRVMPRLKPTPTSDTP